MIKEIEEDIFINNAGFPKEIIKGLKYGRYMRLNMNLSGCINTIYTMTIKEIWK